MAISKILLVLVAAISCIHAESARSVEVDIQSGAITPSSAEIETKRAAVTRLLQIHTTAVAKGLGKAQPSATTPILAQARDVSRGEIRKIQWSAEGVEVTVNLQGEYISQFKAQTGKHPTISEAEFKLITHSMAIQRVKLLTRASQ